MKISKKLALVTISYLFTIWLLTDQGVNVKGYEKSVTKLFSQDRI